MKEKQDEFLISNSDKPILELVKELGISEATVRRRLRKLGFPPRKRGDGVQAQPKNIEESFVLFLQKGRTKDEIVGAFGKDANKLLRGEYKGLSLFTQRDAFMRKLYILLPISDEKPEIKEKDWKFSFSKDEFGLPEPYIVTQLPNFKGNLIIAPLFDVHYGHFAHKSQKFQSYLRWIAETPNVYAILGGDMMENAIDDGRGMSYDQKTNPESQLSYMKNALAPIAHKCLVSVPGN